MQKIKFLFPISRLLSLIFYFLRISSFIFLEFFLETNLASTSRSFAIHPNANRR